MIKTIQQAIAIQERRVVSGKRGYARAVRRFMVSAEKEIGEYLYLQIKDQLPVTWEKKKDKKVVPNIHTPHTLKDLRELLCQ